MASQLNVSPVGAGAGHDVYNETLLGSVVSTFKIRRSRAKANVTRIVNNIKDLMSSKDNLKLVIEKTAKLDTALQTFITIHEDYHSLLVRARDPADIDVSLSVEYRNRVIQKVESAHDLVKTWTESIKRSMVQTLRRPSHASQELSLSAHEIQPDDSASHTKCENSSLPHSSLSQTTSVLRVKASAEAAALEAEAESLRAQQELDFERLRLEQRQAELKLQRQLARAKALEKTYAAAADADKLQVPTEVKCTHSTPICRTTASDESVLVKLVSDTKQQQQSLVETLQLPKTEIMTFDGNPLKYWTFTRMFQNTVDRESISDQSKLALLMQYTTGPAKRVIECCAVMSPEEGFGHAKRLLAQRFGDPFVISEQWVTHIINRPDIVTSKSLQDYADDLQTCRQTLASLDRLCELNTSKCLIQVIDKLPNDLRKRWAIIAHDIKHNKHQLPSIDDVVNFVSTSAAQANDPVFGKLMQHKDKPKSKDTRSKDNKPPSQRSSFIAQVDVPVADVKSAPPPSATVPPTPNTGQTVVQKYNGPCHYCGRSHTLFNCDGFKSLKPGERLNFVRSKRLCFNCLQPGHRSDHCQKKTVCTVPDCGQKHTKFLHIIPSRGPNQRMTQTTNPPPLNNMSSGMVNVSTGTQPLNPTAAPYFGATTSASASCGTATNIGKVVLPIIPVRVRGEGRSTFMCTYALLDTGSTQTFCSQELTDMLNIPCVPDTMQLTTLHNSNVNVTTNVVNLEIADTNDENRCVLSHVLTRPKLNISAHHIVEQCDIDKWPHLADVSVPDVNTNEVHLLIGQDNPDLLTPQEVKTGNHGEPYATKTVLGWTLNGPVDKDISAATHVSAHFVETDVSIQRQVERLWKLDDVNDDTSALSINDTGVISLWDKSHQGEDGHYCFDIPFKDNPPKLPSNKSMALHRLQLLDKRFRKDEQLRVKYTASMKELLMKGYAERVPEAELDRSDGRVWYLPHHPVFSERKPDKVRIVFDCAAKCQGTSLNDNIHQGPDLTNKLVGVLFRFRQEPIAFMADIEAMYHQVLVSDPDKDALRFLWWENDNPERRIVVYRMRAHLFGGVWSSSCANYALKRTAKDHASDFSEETVETVLKNFYVDDCLKSVSDINLAIVTVTELRTLLSQGGFNLTKWVSNSREVMHSVPRSDWAKDVKTLVDIDKEHLPMEHALGLLWNVDDDCFCFHINVKSQPLTKRGLLSMIASLYDPMGFVSPYVLAAKLLFQELCRLKVGWDDELPNEIAMQWGRWRDDLPILRGMCIPRCIKPPTFNKVASVQLHHFSDAAEGGYGVVSYARITSIDEKVHCSFLISKAKLAPLKVTTIPRLELAAATVSIQLDQMIRREMQIAFMESVYWTDSMIVLQYVSNEDKRFKTFVANRVAKIREHSTPTQWRYVASGANPADDVSRGMSAKDLVTSKRWISGPPFLWRDASDWPEQPELDNRSALANDPEVKKDPVVYTAQTDESVIMTLLKRHSTWYSLRKAVAWILRIKAVLCGKSQTRGPLSVAEIATAEKEIIRHVQKACFPDINSKSCYIHKLRPTVSEDNLLCVGGRLVNANLTKRAIHPWILPKSHPIVDMIIHEYHAMTGHAGVEQVLAEIRQKFWIIKGRSAVKRILHRCIPCRQRKSPLLTQVMSDLPKDRVASESHAFANVGIDFFGPLLVKRGRSEAKRYGCLFACLTTRAIHIEICHSLTTSAFINALQRFISRRGKPKLVRSDNGTNLVGGEKELRMAIKDWNQNQISDFLRQKAIEWIFNTPTASHMGGAWERLIRSVRSVMISVMNQQSMDDEGLLTLLCLVEAIVNGRPLTKVSDDPRDPTVLTPNHLLLLRPGPGLPPGLFDQVDMYKKQWRQVQYLANVFWRRWLKEYLPILQQRQKWFTVKRDLQVGDLVLVKYENTPRCHWPLGLVVKTYPGKDGHVRSVQLRANNTLYDRPVHKLCLLEGVEER